VYSPKHKIGRCLFLSSISLLRKDTAAYASLSFFTCQRANLASKRQEQNLEEPLRALAPGPRSLRQASHAVAAVDEDVLLEPGFQVNTHSEDFLN
jgi:hypothetical protein